MPLFRLILILEFKGGALKPRDGAKKKNIKKFLNIRYLCDPVTESPV